ncbi:type IV secretory system conjugative DNA transfer family protein [uncultured Thiodictyon sp.]|uniref:type IV secretory system conjugative DNA transfer family protein n=1 Tax=uncultured Thiodictyon sp. TaxID=1846217 RepID=UPI0025E74D1F|nr:type IV secretory system conjugative DNA transfer family protein [uncultured Thiodictyon sp.]
MKAQSFNNAVGPQVRASRPKPGLIVPLLAVLFLVAGLQTATQFYAAATLQPTAIYAPWKIIEWWHAAGAATPDIMGAANFGVIVAGVGMLLIVLFKMISVNSSKANVYLHGSARWADLDDIRAAGLLPRAYTLIDRVRGQSAPGSNGVYVGAWVDRRGKQHYLRHDGPEHVLGYAPTRSGKGVGLVVPTLLSWPASAVIADLKGELWALSAGWRQQWAHNKVLRFEPAAEKGSVCWNPLDEIRLETENEVGDVQNLATLIVDPDGKGLETHWQKTSQALLVGVILHVLYNAKNRKGPAATLPAVDALLANPQQDVRELWKAMINGQHLQDPEERKQDKWHAHPVVAAAAQDMKDRPDEEAGSVLSTAKSYLALYRDPIVARNVGQSEFRIHDLMKGKQAVSLYIITQPNDKARLRPLVRVMINMVVRLLADKMTFEKGRPVASYDHRLLLMLDEFPSLGKLDIMQESLAFIAGYGIKAYLICQDINQLRSRETGYGHDESITSNCHVQVAFPPNRIETAEHLSKLTGQTTVTKEQITTSGHRTSALHGNVSRTIQEVQRPLLTPDECMRMPGPQKTATGDIAKPGDMVVYVAGYPAIYGQQPLYFLDKTFQARAEIPPPDKTDRLRDPKGVVLPDIPAAPTPTANETAVPVGADIARAEA